ncbi:transcriptional regulator, LysR family [Tistlia consotensis]|uniref:Transcriptional regulator, LysR family n=1 Tax=Tistlia consotensis USBA 355 TaxID=560819 RepID=A0A1Y6BU65_9PROT|nr:LysR family transcriptional regulator [Tistlia consotensis]SMF25318.1 transcriptional regulator, LysR family [Tistlia consotensis USBA 355]SNR59551.1 transcriptional regulator, LysR family [Tistlia consotensis]
MQYLRRMLPSTNALFVFEAAVRCGSFTKAAAELNVTQPAVSRMLGRLESHLGVKLFERVPGGPQLTESGTILYRRLSHSFREIEGALREIEARRTGAETVTLSVSTAFTTHWLMPRMSELHRLFPTLDLRFQLLAGPLGGPVDEVDLGMRFVEGEDARHEAALIMPEIVLPICSPAYLEQRRQEGRDGQPFPNTIVNLSKAEPDWSRYFSSERPDGETGAGNSLIFSDYAIVVQAALLGQGIALGWLNVVSHWLRGGALVPAADEPIVTGRRCHLVHLKERPLRPVAAQLRDWIIEETRADVAAIDALYPQFGLARLCRLA